MTEAEIKRGGLRRVLTLPMVVIYGVGVTVGAGIFALVGEILLVSGERAPLSFLLAGLIAGATGVSYALLVRVYPRAAGEAYFAKLGLGAPFGALVGIGVLATAYISSAVIALAFARYAHTLVAIPEWLLVIGVVGGLGIVAWMGIRESVLAAGAITVLELGTLLVIILFGAPKFLSVETVAAALTPPSSLAAFAPVLSGAIIAFFAFIGFEDIENIAEETVEPEKTAPRAIALTLVITVVLYLSLSLIAVGASDRLDLARSRAPLADLFEASTGQPAAIVAAMASIAMVNGILVQMVMSSRVLFGMAKERQIPALFARLDPVRRTPVIATGVSVAVTLALALSFPLLGLAELTSFVILCVFTLVNLSLFRIGKGHSDDLLRRFRWWGLVCAGLCVAIIAFQIWQVVGTMADGG